MRIVTNNDGILMTGLFIVKIFLKKQCGVVWLVWKMSFRRMNIAVKVHYPHPVITTYYVMSENDGNSDYKNVVLKIVLAQVLD